MAKSLVRTGARHVRHVTSSVRTRENDIVLIIPTFTTVVRSWLVHSNINNTTTYSDNYHNTSLSDFVSSFTIYAVEMRLTSMLLQKLKKSFLRYHDSLHCYIWFFSLFDLRKNKSKCFIFIILYTRVFGCDV